MKLSAVLLTVLVAVLLQATLARYAVGGRFVFDLVLVGVVYAALRWGAVAGMLAGTLGGLMQDVIAGGVVGVGGLTKTIVGFVAGLFGAQFVLAKPQARLIILAVATVLHRLAIIALYAIIDQQWLGVPWAAILGEVVLNGLAGLAAFHLTDALPGAVTRGRLRRRPPLSRRQW